jgi:uncharacterized protein YlxP (DUF503 family)
MTQSLNDSMAAMPLGVLTLEIQLPYAHSLKDKRSVVQSLRNRLRARFNVAVAELDHQDVWQRATLGVASISNSQPLLESLLQQVLAESEKMLGQEVANYSLDYF